MKLLKNQLKIMSSVKKAKFSCKFNPKWKEKYNSEVREVPNNVYAFYCVVCEKSVSCEHMGEADVSRHMKGLAHNRNREAKKASSSLRQMSVTSLMPSENELAPMEYKARQAEVKFSMFIAEHHIPIAVMDHLSPLIQQCFPDSKIAASFSCRRTKTSCIINDAIAPSLLLSVLDQLKQLPFSLSVDGSNDAGLKKMNPLAVKFFDVSRGKVVFNLLGMCSTSGTAAATASSIALAINSVMTKHSLPWSNVVAISMDNASVNFGKRSGILTRLQTDFCAHLYGVGCPCHIIHNTAEQGYRAFRASSHFDLEELAVDLCYWFDKSTKRKAELNSYSEFCDVEYKKVLDFCSTRWLCMQAVVKRIIDMYEPLQSYFRSIDGEANSRFQRLFRVFEDPMTIVHLHFFNHAFPLFDDLNLLLQRQDPQIYRLLPTMTSFIKKVLLRFVDPTVISTLDIWKCDAASLLCLPDDDINIGTLAEQGLLGLLDSGDIGERQRRDFIFSVKQFWITVHKYSASRLPHDDAVIKNSQWVNYFSRGDSDCRFSTIKFFLDRFPVLSLTPEQRDSLREEFDDFKTLTDDVVEIEKCSVEIEYKDIYGNTVKKKGYKMDRIWANIGKLPAAAAQGALRFPLLVKAASIVLAIPHSNADEERIFSSVRKDKTDFRGSLDIDRTLSSLLICQINNDGDCLSYEPTKEVILKSKKVTKEYNQQHSKKSK